MNNILCGHAWSPEWMPGTYEGLPRAFKVCRRCSAPWYDGDQEPKTVIGHLE